MNWKKRKKNKKRGSNGASAQKLHSINIFLGGFYNEDQSVSDSAGISRVAVYVV